MNLIAVIPLDNLQMLCQIAGNGENCVMLGNFNYASRTLKSYAWNRPRCRPVQRSWTITTVWGKSLRFPSNSNISSLRSRLGANPGPEEKVFRGQLLSALQHCTLAVVLARTSTRGFPKARPREKYMPLLDLMHMESEWRMRRGKCWGAGKILRSSCHCLFLWWSNS